MKSTDYLCKYDHSVKTIAYYFPVVLLIMQHYKVVLTFEPFQVKAFK